MDKPGEAIMDAPGRMYIVGYRIYGYVVESTIYITVFCLFLVLSVLMITADVVKKILKLEIMMETETSLSKTF